MSQITELIDYPIVLLEEIKQSKILIKRLSLFMIPFFLVLLTGLIVFLISIIIVPVLITIIAKPSEVRKTVLNSKI